MLGIRLSLVVVEEVEGFIVFQTIHIVSVMISTSELFSASHLQFLHSIVIDFNERSPSSEATHHLCHHKVVSGLVSCGYFYGLVHHISLIGW